MKKNIITLLTIILIVIIGLFVFNLDEIENPENNSEDEEVTETYFQCDQGFIEATFRNSKDKDSSVKLSLSDGRELIAKQVEEENGAKYQTDGGVIFWIKGEDAFLEEEGIRNFQNCSTNFEEDFEIDERLIGNWKWKKTLYSNDQQVIPAGDEFIISLTEDGTMAATTDCNNVSGNFNTAEGVIEFFDLVSTKMYCEDSFESEFKKILNGSESYSFDEQKLVIIFNDGSGSAFFSPEN